MKPRATPRTAGEVPVYRITGAQRGLYDDVRYRQRRYAISMAVRTVCFLLAVVVSGPLRWVLIAGAVVLPYFAVVMANGGRESEPPLPEVSAQHPQLPGRAPE